MRTITHRAFPCHPTPYCAPPFQPSSALPFSWDSRCYSPYTSASDSARATGCSRAKRLPSRSTFLAGEEMDLPFPSPPFASLDQPDPISTHSSRRDSIGGGSISGTPAYLHHSRVRSPSRRTHKHKPTNPCPAFLVNHVSTSATGPR